MKKLKIPENEAKAIVALAKTPSELLKLVKNALDGKTTCP